jgi:hypothetical protein
MKRILLTLAGLIVLVNAFAQPGSGQCTGKHITVVVSCNDPASQSKIGIPDDSFELTPDTLWFLTGSDFMEGKPFQIVNNHSYSIDVLHIDQFGIQCPTCIPWYTVPGYTSYPVTVPANSSITTVVKFFAIDSPRVPLVYDTLNVNTAGHSGHVILVADSNIVQIGIAELAGIKLMAAPNPFSDAVRITIRASENEKVSVTVYDALMRPMNVIFSGELVSGSQNFFWNGTDMNGNQPGNGVYFLRLKSAHGEKTLKIVKV